MSWCHDDATQCSTNRRRLGGEACRAKVTLEVNWQPQRFKLSPALGSLLGVQSDTRARVLQVRHSKCYDTTVRCTQCGGVVCRTSS